MNLLHDIFLENFGKRYYFTSQGRAYVEYVNALGSEYSGKICFFHFSHADIKLNSYHDYEIVKFIKLFYSNAYDELIPLMKYAIEKQFVMSMNSLDEYTFVIKFWNEDKNIRSMFETCIFEFTGKKIIIGNDRDIRFFELEISVKGSFHINKIIIYAEKDLKNTIQYKETYIQKENIFMTLAMDKYLFSDGFSQVQKGVLIKFQDPIKVSDSSYLMEYFYSPMKIPFSAESLYVGFVEQGFKEENLYFTHNYSIPA